MIEVENKMNSDDARRLVRHCMEDGFNEKNMAVIDEVFHVDYVRHAHPGQKSVSSLAEHKADLLARHKSFENARFTIQDIVADGDMVAVRFLFSGTHAGEFMGVPATGRKVERATAAFFRVRDGKIAEGYIVSDAYGLLKQLTD